MTTKIDLKRLKDIAVNDDMNGKYIVSDNGSVKFVEDNELISVFSSSTVVNGFYIKGNTGNILNANNGSVISNVINGKQYVLNIDANKDFTKTFAEGGLVDVVNRIPFEQPVLTSNTSSNFFGLTASSANETAFNMFDGKDSTQWVSTGAFPQTITITLQHPIAFEKIAIRNGTDATQVMATFRVEAQNSAGDWIRVVNIDEIEGTVTDKGANAWNEYVSTDVQTQFKAIRITVISSVGNTAVGVSRINIIGEYFGAFVPNTRYNLFVIGKENIAGGEATTISTTDDFPKLPEGYTYGVKIGKYTTGILDSKLIDDAFPKVDLVTYFNNNHKPY